MAKTAILANLGLSRRDMTPTTIQVSRALAATLSVQAIVTMATLTVPVFAPAASADIGLEPSNIGIFASIIYFGAMASSLLSGGLSPRYGAIRVSQIGLGSEASVAGQRIRTAVT